MASKADLRKKYFGTTNFLEMGAKFAQDRAAEFENMSRDIKDWVHTDFPYYVPSDQLPCPLPTMADIEAARDTEHDLTRETGLGHQFVYRVSMVYAVKFSPSPLILQEAENLLFLAKNTQIRLPKVYAAFDHQGVDPLGVLRNPRKCPDRSSLPRYYFLVMEYIPGKVCHPESWKSLSDDAQQNIMRKIAGQMRLLRNVPTPSPPYYGRIHHRGWFPRFPQLVAAGPPGHLRGPYDSHEDFLNAVYTTSEVKCCHQVDEDFLPQEKLYLQSFHQIMKRAAGKEPVLSHLDFKLEQVMLLENEEDSDDPDVVIIDWAWMGWVPAYMDTARSFDACYNPFYCGLYEWEMSKDVDPAHLDAALYFKQFCTETCNLPF